MRVDHAMTAAAGGTYEDTEGLINLPLTVREIRASAFFKELGPTEFRVSLRSKGAIDVAAVARQFGGGGHKNAAGCTVPGDVRRGATGRGRRHRSRHCGRPGAGARPAASRGMSRPRAVAGAPEGGLVVDKPAGPTSHDVVAVARRALGQPRIGHTGTLDPLATGVLPLLLGRATRLAQFLASSDKTYLATIQFGQATSSYDAAGEPIGTWRAVALDPAAVEAALARFRGRQLQVPPAVSAKKVGGHRAYDLARREKPVELAAVEVDGDRAHADRLRRSPCRRAGHLFGRVLRALAGPRPRRRDGGWRAPGGAPPRAERTVHARRQRRAGPPDGGPLGGRRLWCAPWPTCCRIGQPWRSQKTRSGAVGHGQALAVAERPAGGAPTAGRLRLIDGAGRLVALAEARAGFLHPVLVLV